MSHKQDRKGQVYADIHDALGWKAMLDAEPALAALRRDVLRKAREWSRGLRAERPFCSRRVMREEIVPRLRPLVGRERRREPLWLCQQVAFNRAYHHLHALLPDCRGCSCPSTAEILDEILRPK